MYIECVNIYVPKSKDIRVVQLDIPSPCNPLLVVLTYVVAVSTPTYGSSKEAACVGIGVGVAVEVWCMGDAGGQTPSVLTFNHCWGSAVAPIVGAWLLASHTLGVLCVPLRQYRRKP